MISWSCGKPNISESVRTLFPFRRILRREMANARFLFDVARIDGGLVVDVGCGAGTSLGLFPPEVRTVAFDASFEMVRTARNRSKGLFVVASAQAIPFKDGSFHVLSAIGLLEYDQNPAELLHEFKRVVVSTGAILLTFSPQHPLNLARKLLGGHIYLMTLEHFRKMASQAGLECRLYKKSLIQYQLLLQ